MAFAEEISCAILNRCLNADSFVSMWPSSLCRTFIPRGTVSPDTHWDLFLTVLLLWCGCQHEWPSPLGGVMDICGCAWKTSAVSGNSNPTDITLPSCAGSQQFWRPSTHYFSWGFPHCFSPGVEYKSIKISTSKSGSVYVTTEFAK